MISKIKRVFLGDPLASHRERHERLNIPIALAVFASDALSSTAYATEEILIALVGSAYAAQSHVLSTPVALAIVTLMAIVVISYRQVIRTYSMGGGTYEVSKDSLGPLASQVAGGALLIDYVLTVAVSIAAGVAAITSTGLVPFEKRVSLAILFILAMTFMNLRGVRESAKVIAVPAYLFILSMVLLTVVGLWKVFSGDVIPLPLPAGAPEVSYSDMAMILVLLNAFAHGCAALTGIEAIADGITAFKEPSAKNANRTLAIMGVILGVIFLSITYLANQYGVIPRHDETVISQIARGVFGGESFIYYFIQIMTMVILVLAANTSYAGFPRLANILARDGYIPRQFTNMGDRLVFSNGILVLGIFSCALILFYQADTHALIPLYALGVFLSFTLAQAGMVIHHWKFREEHWQSGLVINAVGAVTTGIVTLIIGFEKFAAGAWIVILAIPILVVLFRSVKNHYLSIGKQLALPVSGYCPIPIEHTVLVLVSSLHRGTIPALEYAKTISHNVEAVHIELNKDATERLRKAWDEWGCGVPLTILKSPFRSLSQPLLDYVEEVETRHEHDLVTIIVPEFVTKKWWHNLLHNQSSLLIKTLLRLRKGKVVTTVRYFLDE